MRNSVSSSFCAPFVYVLSLLMPQAQLIDDSTFYVALYWDQRLNRSATLWSHCRYIELPSDTKLYKTVSGQLLPLPQLRSCDWTLHSGLCCAFVPCYYSKRESFLLLPRLYLSVGLGHQPLQGPARKCQAPESHFAAIWTPRCLGHPPWHLAHFRAL